MLILFWACFCAHRKQKTFIDHILWTYQKKFSGIWNLNIFKKYSKIWKGHDPNAHFSKMEIFAGWTLWRLQIKKWSLMGCSIFNVEIWKKFHFGREKWPICKILTSNRKFKVGVTLKTTLPKSETTFRDNIGTFLFECVDFKDLCTT